MSKLNKNSINLNFKFLTILAFSMLFVPVVVSASYGTSYTYNTSNGYNEIETYNPNPSVSSINPKNVNGNQNSNNNIYSNNVDNNNYNYSNNPVEAENFSDLTSNVIYGSNTFLPSGIIQWILFAIIILLIVILARKFFRGEEHYLATPLKHD